MTHILAPQHYKIWVFMLLCFVSTLTMAQEQSIKEESVNYPTYYFDDPNPLPAFVFNPKIYPKTYIKIHLRIWLNIWLRIWVGALSHRHLAARQSRYDLLAGTSCALAYHGRG
mgnify:CR=1 FL=1